MTIRKFLSTETEKVSNYEHLTMYSYEITLMSQRTSTTTKNIFNN